MLILDIFNRSKNKDIQAHVNIEPQAYSGSYSLYDYFNGEKDFFAMAGSGKEYNVDYYEMSKRAYNLYVTNEFVKAGVDRLVQFLVGTGLELYPTPKTDFLKLTQM